MTTRPIAATGCITAAILLAIAGLPSQARSDNQVPINTQNQGSLAASWESLAESFGGFKADTRPSRDVTMQFPSSTEIREVKAVGGQRVKKGDVLIRARDADILAAIAAQRDLAENDNEIQGAQKQAELAKFKLDRLEGAQTKFSPTEYEEARIGAEVSRVQAEQAKRNKQQNVLKLKQAEAQYERYFLEAPFDGIIEEVMVEVGEGVTEQTKVLRMVNIEKLWLDPYASTPETIRSKLKEGSPAWVLVDMPDSPRLVQGKVLYVSPVADSVSQTRRVRVEIDNPEAWPAGTQAKVRFTEPGKEWEKYRSAVSASGSSERSFRAIPDIDLTGTLSQHPPGHSILDAAPSTSFETLDRAILRHFQTQGLVDTPILLADPGWQMTSALFRAANEREVCRYAFPARSYVYIAGIPAAIVPQTGNLGDSSK